MSQETPLPDVSSICLRWRSEGFWFLLAGQRRCAQLGDGVFCVEHSSLALSPREFLMCDAELKDLVSKFSGVVGECDPCGHIQRASKRLWG